MSSERRQEILEKRLKGMSYQAVADSLNISRQRVQQIIAPPKNIRDLVFSRANGKCEGCGILVGRSGQVHHLYNTLEDYNDTDNLQLLCVSCHKKAHNSGDNGMPKLIKVHDNVYDELTLLKKEGETYSEVIVRLITLYQVFQKVQGK